MRNRTAATGGIAVIAAITLAAVAACSSSSSSSSSSSPSASASSSSSSNPLSGGSASGSVVIGSANFPENELLATVYAQALKAKGINVTTKLNIGAREVYYPQVEKGTISIIPEYNGTLLTVEVDKTSNAKSTAAVDAALAANLPSALQVLQPAPAQDSDSITVTQATAYPKQTQATTSSGTDAAPPPLSTARTKRSTAPRTPKAVPAQASRCADSSSLAGVAIQASPYTWETRRTWSSPPCAGQATVRDGANCSTPPR